MMNHLWQSTVFAVIVWLLTLALRRNRAAVRHALWLAASIKFLIPFSALVSIGGSLEWRVAAVPQPAIAQIAVPLLSPSFEMVLPASASPSSSIPSILVAVWLAGAFLSAMAWFRLWRRVRAALRDATPLSLDLPIPVLTSPARQEPAVIGIRRPVLLLPGDIAAQLTGAQLQAILAHELCHVKRRDNLTGAIHMFVESIFWFHPLVWWVGARLVEEREKACDEEVLRLGNEPGVYAEGILNVCRFSVSSPLPCASGASDADLRKRIEAIVSGGISANLTLARKLLLAVAGVSVIAGPVLVGLLDAQSTGLKFEVDSIKPAKPAEGVGPRAIGLGPAPGGSFRARAVTLRHLILAAYGIQDFQLASGPGWTASELYDIEAKPDKPEAPSDPQTAAARFRERLRGLLADRFQLDVRKDPRDMSGYVLTVAKGGLKVAESRPDAPKDSMRRGFGVLKATGAPIEFLVVNLTQILGRPVADQTGLAGKRFDFELRYAEDEATIALANAGLKAAGKPGEFAPDPSAPSLFTALQSQLGLKLDAAKAPADYYVILRAEKPKVN